MGQLPQQPLSYMAPSPAPPLRFGRGLFGWVLFLGIAVMLFMLLSKRQATYTLLPLDAFVQRIESSQFTTIVVEGDELTGIAAGGMRFRTALPPGMSSNWDFVHWLLDQSRGKAALEVRNPDNMVVNILLPLVPWLLIFLFIWFFVFRQLRKANAARPAVAAPIVAVPAGPGRWVPDEPGKADQA